MSEREGPIVTLDGPAGSGKSSTAREVAHRLGFRHLDSGALYRALTWALLESGADPEEWDELSSGALDGLGVRMEPTPEGYRVRVGERVVGEELRTDRVTRHVSQVARLPAVRDTLIGLQRSAGASGRLVADGRDMGTVVFPEAEVKVYLVADLAERARRRLLQDTGREPDRAQVAREAERLGERDRADRDREHSPLRPAEDAWELDTTGRTFDEQVGAIVARVAEVDAHRGLP